MGCSNQMLKKKRGLWVATLCASEFRKQHRRTCVWHRITQGISAADEHREHRELSWAQRVCGGSAALRRRETHTATPTCSDLSVLLVGFYVLAPVDLFIVFFFCSVCTHSWERKTSQMRQLDPSSHKCAQIKHGVQVMQVCAYVVAVVFSLHICVLFVVLCVLQISLSSLIFAVVCASFLVLQWLIFFCLIRLTLLLCAFSSLLQRLLSIYYSFEWVRPCDVVLL